MSENTTVKKSFEKGRIKKFSELVIHGAQLLQL